MNWRVNSLVSSSPFRQRLGLQKQIWSGPPSQAFSQRWNQNLKNPKKQISGRWLYGPLAWSRGTSSVSTRDELRLMGHQKNEGQQHELDLILEIAFNVNTIYRFYEMN